MRVLGQQKHGPEFNRSRLKDGYNSTIIILPLVKENLCEHWRCILEKINNEIVLALEQGGSGYLLRFLLISDPQRNSYFKK